MPETQPAVLIELDGAKDKIISRRVQRLNLNSSQSAIRKLHHKH